MAFTEKSNDGVLNGTSDVTIVAAPGSNTRRIVKNINISNKDTAAVTVTVEYDNNGTKRRITKKILQVDDDLTINDPIVLDATTKLVTAKMSGAAATTNPDFIASYADVTD